MLWSWLNDKSNVSNCSQFSMFSIREMQLNDRMISVALVSWLKHSGMNFSLASWRLIYLIYGSDCTLWNLHKVSESIVALSTL